MKAKEYIATGLAAATVLAAPLYSGCATIPAGAYRMNEQLGEITSPLDVPSRLTRGARDAVLGGAEAGVRDPFLQTEQYKETGVVVGTIRDNKALDIATEVLVGAGIGAVVGHNSGAGVYKAFSDQAILKGAAIGASAAAVSRGLEEVSD